MGRREYTYHTKLQVPIDQRVRDGLEERAKQLGFDSAQAYIRFWANAEVNGHSLFGETRDIKRPDMQALRYIELLLSTHKPEFKSAQEALDYAVKQINRMKNLHYLDKLFN